LIGIRPALAVVALAAAAVVRVDVTVQGRGVARPEAGSVVVRSAQAGTVTEVRVRPGDVIDEGTVVAKVGERPVMTAPGTVDYVDVRAGDVVVPGAPLIEVVPSSEPLVGFMAVPATERDRLGPGALVRLRVDGHGSGTLEATVVRIGAQLLTDARARELFGAEAPRGPSFLAVLKLPKELRNGALFTAAVTVERPSVLELVFGNRRGS